MFFSEPIYAIYEPSELARYNISVGWKNTLQSSTLYFKSRRMKITTIKMILKKNVQ